MKIVFLEHVLTHTHTKKKGRENNPEYRRKDKGKRGLGPVKAGGDSTKCAVYPGRTVLFDTNPRRKKACTKKYNPLL